MESNSFNASSFRSSNMDLKQTKQKLDAQRQYVVIGTLALLFFLFCFFRNFDVNRAAAPKGTEGDLKTMLTIT